MKFNDGKSGYLSQSALPLYFGLDEAQTVDRIEVRWPRSPVQVIEGVDANRIVVIEEGKSWCYREPATAGPHSAAPSTGSTIQPRHSGAAASTP